MPYNVLSVRKRGQHLLRNMNHLYRLHGHRNRDVFGDLSTLYQQPLDGIHGILSAGTNGLGLVAPEAVRSGDVWELWRSCVRSGSMLAKAMPR